MIIADTVNQQMYAAVRNMILEQELKPGESIDPKAIAEKYNVSLMPVRNALQQLTVEGLVITKQRVGSFVRQFTSEDLHNIFDTRKMFELYCIERYFDNISKHEVKYLFEKQLRMDPLANAVMRGLDEDFHAMIVRASNNEYLIHQYNNMSTLYHIGYYYKGDMEAAKDEHIEIMQEIMAGDKIKTKKALEKHLQRASTELA